MSEGARNLLCPAAWCGGGESFRAPFFIARGVTEYGALAWKRWQSYLDIATSKGPTNENHHRFCILTAGALVRLHSLRRLLRQRG